MPPHCMANTEAGSELQRHALDMHAQGNLDPDWVQALAVWCRVARVDDKIAMKIHGNG